MFFGLIKHLNEHIIFNFEGLLSVFFLHSFKYRGMSKRIVKNIKKYAFILRVSCEWNQIFFVI